jgi:anti-anti-sigma factor
LEVDVTGMQNIVHDTTVERNGRAALVRLAGDVVAANAPILRGLLKNAVAEGAREITLDFTRVAMVDSAGLGLLIAAHNSLQKAGGRLAVVHASAEILSLFRSMRIHQHFTVAGD